MRELRAAITYRSILEWDVIRLIQAVHYSRAMRRSGVPDKVRLKILRRVFTAPFVYARRRELARLTIEMQRRFEESL